MVAKATYYVVSDVHVNLRKHPVWEKNRFTLLIDELMALPKATIVFNGDLFDKARPSLEEQNLVLSAIHRLSAKHTVYALAGNHEVLSANVSTFKYLPANDFTICTVRTDVVGNTNVNFVDWLHLDDIPKLDKGGVLVSHFRSNLGIVKAEVDTQRISNKFDLVILGDIHDKYSPHDNMHYTNSPYSIHYTPVVCRFGFIELTVEDDVVSHKYHTLNLPQKQKIVVQDLNKIPDIVAEHKNDLLKLVVSGDLATMSELVNYRNVTYDKTIVWDEQLEVQQPNESGEAQDILEPLESLVEAVTGPCDGVLTRYLAELKGAI